MMNNTLEIIANIVDLKGSTSCSRQITSVLRGAIESGQIPHGTRLPSFRQVAERLGVSRSTVHRSFATLTSQGYIKCVQGRTSIVETPFQTSASIGALTFQRSALFDCSPASIDEQRPSAVTTPVARDEKRIDSFTSQRIQYALKKCCRGIVESSTEQQCVEDTRGYEPLREAMAEYLRRSRWICCTKYDIAVVSGTSTRLELILMLFINPGDSVAIAANAEERLVKLLCSHGARLTLIPVDENGLDVFRLADLDQEVKLVYATPSISGSVMSIDRRKWLVNWAAKTGTLVVEDDTQSERSTGHLSPPAIQALDASERVLYLPTHAEPTAALLKVAFVVAPANIMQPFLRLKRILEPSVSLFEQMVLSEFIASGSLEQMIAKQRLKKNTAQRTGSVERVANEVSSLQWFENAPGFAGGMVFELQGRQSMLPQERSSLIC